MWVGDERDHDRGPVEVCELVDSLGADLPDLAYALRRDPHRHLCAPELPLRTELRPAGVHLVEDRRVDVARRARRRQELRRDTDRVRHRPVGLLAAVSALDALDQLRPQQRPEVKVEVARVALEPLRELAVREHLVVLTEQLEHAKAQRVPERLQLLGPVDRENSERLSSRKGVGHPPVHIGIDAGCLDLKLLGGRRIEDHDGLAVLRSNEARRCCLVRRLCEGATYGLGPLRARDQEQDERGRLQHRDRHRDAVDQRLELRLGRDRAALSLCEPGCVRVQRRDVAVGAHAEQNEVERHAFELLVVVVRGTLRAELAADAVHGGGLNREAVEQRALRQPVVRPLVVGGDAPVVTPPDLGGAPVRLELGCQLVCALRSRAAGERDVAGRSSEQVGAPARRRLEVGCDLDVYCSPAASSCDRSIAAWIASRKAARTPFCSSTRIARIVVPPGEVTASRRSTGCISSSRSNFAGPSIVWTTSWVDTSRERPSRMPASIIASARSAKYAGPEPDTAVTASIAVSGRRTTRPRFESTLSARSRFSSPACAPAHSPAIPSCTVDGAFGIARTTGTPFASRDSICEVGIAAATERTVCSVEIEGAISPRSVGKSCGVTASTTMFAPATASAFDSVASTP